MGKNAIIFYLYIYMQNICLNFFNPSFVWSNICLKLQKHRCGLRKKKNFSVYNILSKCLPFNSCKSLSFFSFFNKNNNGYNNSNIQNNTGKNMMSNNISYDISNYDYDSIDNTYILEIYNDIYDVDNFDDDYYYQNLIIDKKTRDREAIINLNDEKLRFFDDKKFTLNLCENDRNIKFSKNINCVKNKKFTNKFFINRKSVSLNTVKVNKNNSNHNVNFISEKKNFFYNL